MKNANIKTAHDITGEVAKELRDALGLTQPEFWQPVCVSQSAGSRYESGAFEDMSGPIRVLLFARYVAEVNIDALTPEGAKNLRRLGRLQKADTKKPATNQSQ